MTCALILYIWGVNMRFSFEGFNLEVALSLQKETETQGGKKEILKLELVDMIILRWFTDLFTAMKKYEGDYIKADYETIQEYFPLLKIEKPEFYDRLNALVELEILKCKQIDINNNDYEPFSSFIPCYGFGGNYARLTT